MKPIFLSYILLSLIICFSQTIGHAQEEAAKTANIEGFRSAKFGMDQSTIVNLIKKEFNVAENDIKIEKNPLELTTSIKVSVKDLLPDSGPSEVFYILGYNTKTLIQINIIWSSPQNETQNITKMGITSRTLTNYFLQQGFKKDDMITNAQLKDGSILFFRGADPKGRMVILQMLNPPTKDDSGTKASAEKTTSLRLTYVEKPDTPDIYKVKKGDF